MTLGLALAWAAILVGCWLGWQLLRQNGRLLLRLEALEERLNELESGEPAEPAGLPVGSAAPDFSLPDLAGQTTTLAELRGQSVLVLFFNPACGFCRELLPKLQRNEGGRKENGEGWPRLLIISTGDVEANRNLFQEHKFSCTMLLQKESEVAATYQANGTPSGYLISAEGQIASSLAMGGDALLKLLEGESRKKNGEVNARLLSNGAEAEQGRSDRFSNRSLARSKLKRDGLKAGTVAPDFRLPRLDGRGELSLSELRGRRVLLVFSSPSCGPCNTLAPELEKFHRAHPELEVVMISKGEPKENRAKVKEHGLTFPIVLQQQWEISRRYAMFATPIAYLIDEKGTITQDVAVGGELIIALLASFPPQEKAEPLFTA
jgi:peroxiredoxin